MVIFTSRQEAGETLGRKLSALKPELIDPIVLGIPRGGVVVGYCIAKAAKPLACVHFK